MFANYLPQWSQRAYWRQVALYALTYFGLGVIGAIVAQWNANIVAVWYPSGLALYLVLQHGPRFWPAVAVGSLLVNQVYFRDLSLPAALFTALGSSAAALLAEYLLRRVYRLANPFLELRSCLIFAVAGALLPALLSASCGVLMLWWTGMLPSGEWFTGLRSWWLADAAGALLIAPLLLSGPFEVKLQASARREHLALFCGAGLTLLVLITVNLAKHSDVFVFVMLPFVLWAAIRFDLRSTMLVTLIASAGAATCNLIHRPDDQMQQLLSLQVLAAWLALLGMTVVATLNQIRQMTDALRLSSDALVQMNATLEQQVAQRTEQLRLTNQELEAFAYSVSHDLRAPLRSIAGFADVVIEDEGERLSADGQHYLTRIKAAALRMNELIDAFLQLARISSANLQLGTIDLSALARDIARELQEAEPDRQVNLVIAPGLRAYSDEKLIRILLVNLLANAWKFSRQASPATIRFDLEQSSGRQVFVISDNGAGFDMAKAGKLFTPFSRLHASSEFEGTGIGLATCRRIVQKLQGEIWAQSEPGRGTRIYFALAAGAAF